MAEPRVWAALEIRSRAIDHEGALEGLVSAALLDTPPLAIHDLNPPPPPPGGVWDPTCPPPPEPPPTAIAWRACFGDAATRDRAADALAVLAPEIETAPVDLPDDDWVARSQQALTAIEAGRFIVAPPWDLPSPPPADRTVIVIEPSMGFGTGHHQTTRLCLTALSDLDLGGRSVLDLGTGSGVLALAASHLGAARIRALDVDADAIAAAERSAALNTVPTPVAFATADLFGDPPAPADLVVANLTGAMLIKAAAILAAATAPGGVLVISGFMDYEADGVEQALTAFAVERRLAEDVWRAAVLRRATP